MLKNNPYVILIKNVWYHSRHSKGLFFSGVGLTLAAQIIAAFNPYLIGEVFNAIQMGGDNVFENVVYALALVFFVKVFFWVLWWPGRILERRNILCASESFWDEYYQKITKLPYIWHQDHHSGDTISRIQKGETSLRNFMENHYMYTNYGGNFLGPIVFLLFISPKLAFLAVLFSVFMIFMAYYFDKILIHHTRKLNKEEHYFSGVIFDYIGNFMTVLSLRLGERTKDQALKAFRRFFPHYIGSAVTNENKWALISFSSVLFQSLLLGYFIWDQLNTGQGVVAIGTTVAVYRYLEKISKVMSGFAADYQKLLLWRTDFEGLETIDGSLDQVTIKQETTEKLPKKWQEIKLQKAIFSYKQLQSKKSKLKSVSIDNLTLARGKKIALVGQSGAGKTTLMALIRGILDFKTSKLLVDGQEKEIAYLHNSASLIPQDPEIFENTIAYNITFGLSGHKKRIHKMIGMACFDDVLNQLPNGLKTNIKEKGVNLSG